MSDKEPSFLHEKVIHDSHTGGLAYTSLAASSLSTWTSGGTSHYLPEEREKATFITEKLTNFLDGGSAKATSRRRDFILAGLEDQYPNGFMEKYRMDRHSLISRHFQDFIAIHSNPPPGFRPSGQDVAWMGANAVNTGSLMPHMSLFCMTLREQGSEEQVRAWLPKALSFQIIGGYAQTELGHGSNVRGLQTTASYDKSTQEFVLNTNTLQGTKWWNSNIGVAATHCVLYAQLMVGGESFGLHVFFVQLRNEKHYTLPGIECGDCGEKLGDHAIDTGYMRLLDVRIPRTHLLCKRQEVQPDGTYAKKKNKSNVKNPVVAQRMAYMTMMGARSGMTEGAADFLSRSVTTAVRYSCVRHQGFVDTKSSSSSSSSSSSDMSHRAPENKVIDYQMQSYRLFKWLSTAYGCKFAGKAVLKKMGEVREALSKGDESAGDGLAEMHATSAGMKGLVCQIAADGMEDCRKMLGGHGYLLNSGIAADLNDYVWKVTAEGDPVVMLLQSARFLLKSTQSALKGETKDLVGLVSYLAPIAEAALAGKVLDPASVKPALPPGGAAGFLNLNYLLSLYRYRSCMSAYYAGKAFNDITNAGSGMSFDAAWNKSAVAMVSLAKSHGTLNIVSSFIKTCDLLDDFDQEIAIVMRQLAAFFAISNIIEGPWTGFLTLEEMQLAQQALEDLCLAIRPNAVALVDAFDYPDRVLNSDLGRHDGNVYEALYDFARSSDLNSREVFEGYDEWLKPHLDLDFLKQSSPLRPKL